MLIDIHVHLNLGGEKVGTKETLIKGLKEAGVDKAVLLSNRPYSFAEPGETLPPAEERLKEVMEWSAYSDALIPFFWIDPLEEDAPEQVEMAARAGIAGFKCICNRHNPCDERPMRVWEKVAEVEKPILFHSGILYSSRPCSNSNRPANFEGLFDIPNLRFALAHVSWPWHDECIAVYGYWSHRKHVGSTTSEMFIDTTPGTPAIYRDEVITKLYTVGYDIEDNLLFGSDCTSEYRPEYTKTILARDKTPLDRNQISAEAREKYYAQNALRFLGLYS